jgi:hypothetical protein
MALVLEIVFGLMILASFYVAYRSARTWQIYQVVLVVFVFLAAAVFFYMGARTLATHQAWGALVKQRQTELANLEQQKQRIGDEGGPDANGKNVKGIRQLRKDLERLATDRGGVLVDVAVVGVKDGLVQLTLKSPEHGLVANSVLFAFDQIPFEEGGRYRGEFKVAAVAEGGPEVQLAPNLPLAEAEMQRLAAAKGPWTLYVTMPIDDPTVFANLDEATKAALLPRESLIAYANAERPLRDYESFFQENYVQRSLLTDAISKTTSNIQRTEAATKEANNEIAYRQSEKANLQADLEKFRYEVKAIGAYQATLEKSLQDLRESLKATYLSSKQQAADLTAAQFQAAEEINQRTAAAQGPALSGIPANQPQ